MFKDDLRRALDAKGWKAADLSAATGIGKSSISQYLSGKNAPSDKRREIIARALGFPDGYFKKNRICVEKPETEISNLPVMVAAKLMGKSKKYVYQGLQEGRFPWGWAVKTSTSWSYYISPVKFTEYTGIIINMKS